MPEQSANDVTELTILPPEEVQSDPQGSNLEFPRNNGIPATTADPNWTPLLATAPDPSYPGAHSAISGAAAAVLINFYGDHDKIDVTSDVLPNVTRKFNSYSAAASEAGLSRIYGGVHTRTDHEAGLKLGHDVAGFVLNEAGSSGFGLKTS